MKLTYNFKLSEFTCKDGTVVPDNLLDNVKELAKALQVIRDEINESISINSAYRTPRYNKKVGGAKNSLHIVAKAADLKTELAPKELKKVIERLIKEKQIPQGGVGLYKSFVHYDIRGYKARWNG